MRLRKLDLKDAPLMLEWMHDKDVVEQLMGDFVNKTLSDAESFILTARNNSDNIHLAIASDENEYMGTVSLKHINKTNNSAEFAISVRKCAMGCGYSWFGMKKIIDLAFTEYDLDCLYWCVSRKNARAVRFYEKHGFCETSDIPEEILSRYSDNNDLKWYSVRKGNMPD